MAIARRRRAHVGIHPSNPRSPIRKWFLSYAFEVQSPIRPIPPSPSPLQIPHSTSLYILWLHSVDLHIRPMLISLVGLFSRAIAFRAFSVTGTPTTAHLAH